jgi:hypothetical protein
MQGLISYLYILQNDKQNFRDLENKIKNDKLQEKKFGYNVEVIGKTCTLEGMIN